jgi:hypothetical protein
VPAESQKTSSRRWQRAGIAATGTVITLGICAALIPSGVLWPNRLFASNHATRGVDVSVYQGTIDWAVLSREDIDFAIIKATEGSGSQDSRFARTWSDARKTDVLVDMFGTPTPTIRSGFAQSRSPLGSPMAATGPSGSIHTGIVSAAMTAMNTSST